MASEPSEIVRAGYDEAAARYRALEHDSARWPRAEWIGELTKSLRPGAAILDLGCATGTRGRGTCGAVPRDRGRHSRNISSRRPGTSRTLSSSLGRAYGHPRPGTRRIISLYTFDHTQGRAPGPLNACATGSGLTAAPLSIEDHDDLARWRNGWGLTCFQHVRRRRHSPARPRCRVRYREDRWESRPRAKRTSLYWIGSEELRGRGKGEGTALPMRDGVSPTLKYSLDY